MPNFHRKRCVFGCASIGVSSVHDFPNPDKFPQHYRHWVEIVGKPLEKLTCYEIYRKKKICNIHFTEKDWNRNNRLNALAVPSLYLPGQKHINSTKIKEQNLKSNGSQNQRIFLSDHTYTFPGDPKCEEIEETADENKTDSNTRVDTMIGVAIKYPCNDNVEYNCDDEDNSSYNYEYDNVVPIKPADDVLPNKSVIEVEILPKDLFSWEKTDVIVADDTEMVFAGTMDASEASLDLGELSMYSDEKSIKHSGCDFAEYRCNECGDIIKGVRYTCVECADWDLCVACEARAAHDSHYMLRVPAQRPYKEMQAALAAIRHQMLKENLFLPEMITRVKQEVKVEDPEVPVSAPQLEADPLAAWGTGQNTLEIFPEPKDKDVGPSRRRRKTTRFSLNRTKKLTAPCNQEKTERNSRKRCNAASQITKELCTGTSLENGNLDTCQPKVQHSKSKNSVDIGSDIIKANKPNCQDTHSKETVDPKGTAARNEAIAKNTKQTGPQSNGTKAPSPRRKGTTKVIGSRSTANTNAKKKRYKIRLPPGSQWRQLLMTMVKSRVTVQLEDVMRKKRVAAC